VKNFLVAVQDLNNKKAIEQFGRVAIEDVFITESEIFKQTRAVIIFRLRYILKKSESEPESFYHC
jgi:hypothetical protein